MLTKKQKNILDFIKSYTKKNDYSPTLEEIKKYFKLSSVATVHQHVGALKERGYLDKTENQRRSINVFEKEKLISVPLLGTIAAGGQIEMFQQSGESIAIPKTKIKSNKNYFTLKVTGESMVEKNINNGDIVLVKQQNIANNGDNVVALIDGTDTTLKTFYKERGHIRLQPANKNMQPIIIERDREFAVQGVVADVIKTNETKEQIKTFVLSSKKDSKERGDVSNYLNRVYNGDIMDVLKDLPDNSVDMVFGDPDYNVGIKYGDNNYTKNFNDYINWYIELTKESMRVLKNDGNLFMMNYPQQNAHLRVKYLDLHFPNINDYVWVYNTNVGHTPKRFTTAHRSILHVRKSPNNKFFKDEVALPYKNPGDRRILKNLANGSRGRMPYSWFEFNLVKNVSKEKTYHACQIPQKLTEMLIKASTKPKEIVLVLFGGSGAEIDVCKKLNRQFVSAEIDKNYCNIINDRLAKGFIDQKYRLASQGKNKIMELSF